MNSIGLLPIIEDPSKPHDEQCVNFPILIKPHTKMNKVRNRNWVYHTHFVTDFLTHRQNLANAFTSNRLEGTTPSGQQSQIFGTNHRSTTLHNDGAMNLVALPGRQSSSWLIIKSPSSSITTTNRLLALADYHIIMITSSAPR